MPRTFKNSRTRTILIVLLAALLIATSLTGCVTNSAGESESIFSIILVRPFAWILDWIYGWCGNFGLALIIFCVITRLIMLPFNIKSKRSMLRLQAVQPKIKEIEKKYPNDKNKQSIEMMALYKKENISPMGGCLTSLITLPLMFALYWPISQPLRYLMRLTSAEIGLVREKLIEIGAKIGEVAVSANTSEMALVRAISDNFEAVSSISDKIFPMDLSFLGMNLGVTPNFRVFDALFFLPIISAATSYLLMYVTRWLQEKTSGQKAPAESQNKMMTWMMPLMSLWIGFTLPAGLAIYWIACNIVGILQEFLITYIVKATTKTPLKEAVKPDGNKNRKKR